MKIPPIIQLGIASLIAWAMSWIFPLVALSNDVAFAASLIFGIAGSFCLVSALRLFRRHKTTINPLDPSKAEQLVIDGIYCGSRNPMYLGLALLLGGWCFYLGGISAFLSLPIFVVAMTELQIKPEEEALSARFGNQYENYRQQVRRWI